METKDNTKEGPAVVRFYFGTYEDYLKLNDTEQKTELEDTDA